MPVASSEAAIVVFSSPPSKIRRSGSAFSSFSAFLRDLGVLDGASGCRGSAGPGRMPEAHEHAPCGRLGERLEHDQVGARRRAPSRRPMSSGSTPSALPARLRPHQLGDQHRADAPLRAEADALEDAEDEQRLVARARPERNVKTE